MTLFHPLLAETISQEALERGQGAINKVRSFKQLSQREEMYINAAAAYYDGWQSIPEKDRVKVWSKGQKIIHEAYPDDIDVTAIYALPELSTVSPSDRSLSHQKHTGEILDRLYKQAPLNPGVIH